MTTQLRERAKARRTRLDLTPAAERVEVRTSTTGDASTPGLRAMLLASGPDRARVALVPDGALLLAGDGVRLDVHVGAGTRLELVEPSGTVAFDMRGGRATWDVRIELAPGATLVWAGEPFVVAAGARVRRSTEVHLAEGARLALRETLVWGRHRERGGHLDQRWSAYGPDGSPVLVEHLLLADTAHRPGILGGHRAVGSVIALGPLVRPVPGGPDRPSHHDSPDGVDDPDVEGRLDLEDGGTVWRLLAHEAHRAVPHDAWRRTLARLDEQ